SRARWSQEESAANAADVNRRGTPPASLLPRLSGAGLRLALRLRMLLQLLQRLLQRLRRAPFSLGILGLAQGLEGGLGFLQWVRRSAVPGGESQVNGVVVLLEEVLLEVQLHFRRLTAHGT